ncbi:MAG: hypothetical protein AAFR93_14435, partial [Pseudomonadota bacterium]
MIVVPGRFSPLHRGHETLLATARTLGEVHVLVLGEGSPDALPVLAQTLPGATLSRAPQIARLGPDTAAALSAHLRTHLPGTTRLFGSDPALKTSAEALGVAYTILDPEQLAMPADGDAIRADLVGHWSLLSPAAKAAHAKRLTLIGPESSGKSTIAAKLVAAYGGPLVP